MARFTVRVELHNAEYRHYEVLYEKMALEGFDDIIVGSEGSPKRLPPGEYNYDGPVSRSDVLAKAEKAAGATGKKYAVLVTESNGRTWAGLTPA